MLKIAAAYIDLLKDRTSTSTDEELASVIGVAKSTIASWRSRGSIPDHIIRELDEKYGISYSDVRNKALIAGALDNFAFRMAITHAILSAGAHLTNDQVADWSCWIASNTDAIHARFFEGTGPISSNDELTSAIMQGYMAVRGGKRLTFDELRQMKEADEARPRPPIP